MKGIFEIRCLYVGLGGLQGTCCRSFSITTPEPNCSGPVTMLTLLIAVGAFVGYLVAYHTYGLSLIHI